VGPSWRVIAGLRNPYEEGGADEDALSFDEASLAVGGVPAPLEGTENEEWEAVPALLLTNALVKLPPPPPLPRFPMGPGVERAFSSVSDSITPTAWSVAPETIPPVQAHTPPASSRRALSFVAGGVALGAAAAVALSLWSPARAQQPVASRWIETPALAAPAMGARVHYLPTTIIHGSATPMAEDRGAAAPAAVAFDRRRATAMVSTATRRAFECGLRGIDTSVEVTFEESGRAVLVNVKGDHPLSPAAETCANEELFTLQVPAFLGGTRVVRVHLDGQTGAIRR
jgi:hypothetical protein